MIQRKQTIYLLIALGLMITMLFTSLVETTITPQAETITNADGSITKTTVLAANTIKMDVWGLHYDGAKTVSFTYYLVLLFLSIASILGAILLYKRRLLQIKLCYAIWIFLIGLLIFSAIYFYRLNEILTNIDTAIYESNYSLTILFPLVSLLLVWLAYKGIVKDEALVKSLDRIR